METPTIEQFKEDVKKNYLVMSRVSPQVRKEFIEFSNEAFCGDYGATLYEIWTQFKEYQLLKMQLFSDVSLKLNYIIDKIDGLNTTKTNDSTNIHKIKLMSGKDIEITKKEV